MVACRSTERKVVVLVQIQTSISRVTAAASQGHLQILTSIDERNESWSKASPGSAIVETMDGLGRMRGEQER